jgi:SpoVK/Ycf46/Vps4 family AAA+-type ATPase
LLASIRPRWSRRFHRFGNDPLTDEIVGQLLQELDGIQSRDSEVFLLAATNHAEQIDRAVLSRFQERLAIPLPDLHGRERLLIMLLQKRRITFAHEEGSHTLAAISKGNGIERTGSEELDRPRRTEGAGAGHRHRWTAALRSDPGRLRLAGDGNHRHRLNRSGGYFC